MSDTEDEELARRVARDRKNAVEVARIAREELRSAGKPQRYNPDDHGDIDVFAQIQNIRIKNTASLQSIANTSFHAMMEVVTETENGSSTDLWYANQDTSVNHVLGVPVRPFTDMAVQVALEANLGESTRQRINELRVDFDGLTLREVIPIARARFIEVSPEISGIYEPGGKIGSKSKPRAKAGLKAVKLDMSREQVRAFIARMSGMMVITGAPGSGKTTVAFQRIRFLFDQQELRTEPKSISFKPELTKIFLANKNLEQHAKTLLEKELQIPSEFQVITGIENFIDEFLKKSWRVRSHAKPILIRNMNSEDYARAAIVGLADSEDLKKLWLMHERQIVLRATEERENLWYQKYGNLAKKLINNIREIFIDARLTDDPNRSNISMERIYSVVSEQYNKVRQELSSKPKIEPELFDQGFKKKILNNSKNVFERVDQELKSKILNSIRNYREKGDEEFKKEISCYSRFALEIVDQEFKKDILNSSKNALELFDREFKEEILNNSKNVFEKVDKEFKNKILSNSKNERNKVDREFKREISNYSKIVLELFDREFKSETLNYSKIVLELFDQEFRKEILNNPKILLELFDQEFQKWLYKVYDPISSMLAFFSSERDSILDRLEKSTGGTANVEQAMRMALREWGNGSYREEDRSWIAWLLRFSLPSSIDSNKKFKNMPSAISTSFSDGEHWSHIAIDEAQDLSVAEASLLGSLVAPNGALTISVDFKQIVSPVKGMMNTDAFYVGKTIKDDREAQLYPFAKNFRQSNEIGRFLQEFYRAAFEEEPTFELNTEIHDAVPQLVIADTQDFTTRIRQIMTVFNRSESVESVAMLQINADFNHMNEIRESLEEFGVKLAGEGETYSNKGLVTSTVEDVKGLEFDACILLGLEDIAPSARSFSKNRAYVGISRPTQRLIMICQEYPTVLRGVDQSSYEIIES